jgi:ATP phosphoribosyltransferase regulatory subunit
MENRNWRLPAGVDELLPPEAWSLEIVRRRVLDVFKSWGYEYIDPPVVEYLDALLVGAGDDMDLQTLKTVDQKSGRQLGVRADMTAQAVRVDAHSRPLEAGAELFGAENLTADAEVIALMLEVLRAVGLEDPLIVLGHMGIYHSFVDGLGLEARQEAALFSAVQSKAETDILELVEGREQEFLVQLPGLMGEREVLDRARETFADWGDGVVSAIDQLERLADLVLEESPEVTLGFDLAELVGYGYHNGPVFSAYHADLGRALARGGRYDDIGEAFGRGRPATGFDVNLNELVSATRMDDGERDAIWIPWMDEALATDDCREAIRSLRASGEVVVAALSRNDGRPARCDRILEQREGAWVVEPVST